MVLTCFCMLVESSQESAQFMWKQHFSPDPDLDTVVSVHEEDLPEEDVLDVSFWTYPGVSIHVENIAVTVQL